LGLCNPEDPRILELQLFWLQILPVYQGTLGGIFFASSEEIVEKVEKVELKVNSPRVTKIVLEHIFSVKYVYKIL